MERPRRSGLLYSRGCRLRLVNSSDPAVVGLESALRQERLPGPAQMTTLGKRWPRRKSPPGSACRSVGFGGPGVGDFASGLFHLVFIQRKVNVLSSGLDDSAQHEGHEVGLVDLDVVTGSVRGKVGGA